MKETQGNLESLNKTIRNYSCPLPISQNSLSLCNVFPKTTLKIKNTITFLRSQGMCSKKLISLYSKTSFFWHYQEMKCPQNVSSFSAELYKVLFLIS